LSERVLPAFRPSRLGPAVLRAWMWTMSLRPAYVLAGLVVVQWLALLALVASIRHNGWLFYQGGDETFYYTAGWGISDGRLPPTSIGYGWALLNAPIALFAGPSYLVGVPAVLLLQVLVLLPLGLFFAYGIGERIAGRWLGYVTALGFVVAPYLVIPGFEQRFHEQWVEQFLPQALGMTGLSDFFAMVVTLGAAWLVLRALDSRGTGDAVLAGLLTGLSIGIKPADVLFLAGPLLAFAAVRRWRTALVYGLAILPGALTLAVWKERGLGHLPIFAGSVAVHAASLGAAAVLPPLGIAVPSSLNLDWGQLGRNMAQFREFFWSMRLVEILPFAGFAAVARVSLAKALFLGGWLAAFVVVKGTSERASVQDGTFFRLLMPAWPAYLVLAASLPLLVPGVPQRLGGLLRQVRPIEWRSRPALTAAALLGAVPLIVVAALPLLHGKTIVTDFTYNTVIPANVDFHLRAETNGMRVRLSWKIPPHGASRIFYRVYEYPTIASPPSPNKTQIIDGVSCLSSTAQSATCALEMPPLADTRRNTYALQANVRLSHDLTYRVAMFANWIDDVGGGDNFLLSEPVRVHFGA
jgi:hypothetical protein